MYRSLPAQPDPDQRPPLSGFSPLRWRDVEGDVNRQASRQHRPADAPGRSVPGAHGLMRWASRFRSPHAALAIVVVRHADSPLATTTPAGPSVNRNQRGALLPTVTTQMSSTTWVQAGGTSPVNWEFDLPG